MAPPQNQMEAGGDSATGASLKIQTMNSETEVQIRQKLFSKEGRPTDENHFTT